MRGEGALPGDRSRHRIGCPPEGDEEGVALRVDLVATVSLEGGAEQAAVVLERTGIGLAKLLQQSGRALDVGEEERGRPARWRGPVGRLGY